MCSMGGEDLRPGARSLGKRTKHLEALSSEKTQGNSAALDPETLLRTELWSQTFRKSFLGDPQWRKAQVLTGTG